ncbi:MAG: hypothetical protein C4567_01335 [Deltaproteobacteria bacterium]|nr:MAG: hypothetical protein C4567_01335 [Deltaproteobacteria bacterium]
MPQANQEQIEKNFRAFQDILPSIMETQRGKFALMRDGEIVDYFDTVRDAYIVGQKLYPDEEGFSIQEVIETPIDLGFFSHAVS